MPFHPLVKIGTGYLSEKRISGRGGWEGERVTCDKAIIQWSESGQMSYKSEEADLDLTFMVHFLSMQVLIRTGIQRTTTSSPKVNYCFIALCFSWIFPASFKKIQF